LDNAWSILGKYTILSKESPRNLQGISKESRRKIEGKSKESLRSVEEPLLNSLSYLLMFLVLK